MPVDIEYIKDNRAVLQTYLEPLTQADFLELKAKMEGEILPAAPGKLHIIADFRQISNLPSSLLTGGINMMNRAHPNTGLVVCVTQNDFVNAMARIFSGVLSSKRVKVVKSLALAYKEVDALLLEKA